MMEVVVMNQGRAVRDTLEVVVVMNPRRVVRQEEVVLVVRQMPTKVKKCKTWWKRKIAWMVKVVRMILMEKGTQRRRRFLLHGINISRQK